MLAPQFQHRDDTLERAIAHQLLIVCDRVATNRALILPAERFLVAHLTATVPLQAAAAGNLHDPEAQRTDAVLELDRKQVRIDPSGDRRSCCILFLVFLTLSDEVGVLISLSLDPLVRCPLGPLGSSSSQHRRTLELILQEGSAFFFKLQREAWTHF